MTEPSPDVPTVPAPGETTLVHVLVHRESEEYQSELDEKGKPMAVPITRFGLDVLSCHHRLILILRSDYTQTPLAAMFR